MASHYNPYYPYSPPNGYIPSGHYGGDTTGGDCTAGRQSGTEHCDRQNDMSGGNLQMGNCNEIPRAVSDRGISPIGRIPSSSKAVVSSAGSSSEAKACKPMVYRNNCQIFVRAQAHREYAKMIARDLKACTLTVGITFLKPVPKSKKSRTVIAGAGTVVIKIWPENEAHRSVTVHIPPGMGELQVHRNMLWAEALQHIKNRFSELKKNRNMNDIGADGVDPPNVVNNLRDPSLISNLMSNRGDGGPSIGTHSSGYSL